MCSEISLCKVEPRIKVSIMSARYESEISIHIALTGWPSTSYPDMHVNHSLSDALRLSGKQETNHLLIINIIRQSGRRGRARVSSYRSGPVTSICLLARHIDWNVPFWLTKQYMEIRLFGLWLGYWLLFIITGSLIYCSYIFRSYSVPIYVVPAHSL